MFRFQWETKAMRWEEVWPDEVMGARVKKSHPEWGVAGEGVWRTAWGANTRTTSLQIQLARKQIQLTLLWSGPHPPQSSQNCPSPLRQVFLSSAPLVFWSDILCCGGCTLHCRVLGSIHSLHPLNANSIVAPAVTLRTSPDVTKCPLRGKVVPS